MYNCIQHVYIYIYIYAHTYSISRGRGAPGARAAGRRGGREAPICIIYYKHD